MIQAQAARWEIKGSVRISYNIATSGLGKRDGLFGNILDFYGDDAEGLRQDGSQDG